MQNSSICQRRTISSVRNKLRKFILKILNINRTRLIKRRDVRKLHNVTRRTMTITSNNRQITLSSNRKCYIRALLRRRKAACEIIVILGSNIRQTAFSTISHESTSIDTLHSSVINRNNQRILQVLITEPLIHNESIGTERQRTHRDTSNLNRQAKIVSKSSNIPTASGGSNLRNAVFRLRNPSTFRILTIELLPVIPNKAVRNKEIVSVQIDVVHDRSKQRLHTHDLGAADIERISGQHFLAKERDNISGIKSCLNGCGAIKSGSRHINTGGIQRKMRFNITIHLLSPPVSLPRQRAHQPAEHRPQSDRPCPSSPANRENRTGIGTARTNNQTSAELPAAAT